MKKRVLVLASAAIITMASIGCYAFAQGSNGVRLSSDQEKVTIGELETTRNYNSRQKPTIQEPVVSRNNNNHCENSEEMIQIMKENGFEDMAKWMKDGNFKSMDEFMNNMSDTDYQKMLDLMSENGYGNMSKMMESIGREDMINMHNSMMDGNGSNFNKMGNMMGRFQ
ncbi:hypothetical protein [Alkaliphilus sp. B6464]|uniref:hypothetical protein n=1 Tax=Alkaliphilus sp. B6464 TaxID=2731219 RepID=UPI001BAA6B57|nr:hypothetical protein [Alkaliphilus sp. B6464]QUH20318.1 hypothetical protein HYG84_10665 [Alkaliphilus sp. B6464]